MALVLNDRVKETTTTTGTGTINLGGAATGFETFVAGIGNSNTTYYCIAGQGTTEFEVGIGTVTDASPDTLSRTTILSSSNSDSAVNFSAGTKDVFCTLPASKTIREVDTALNVPTGTTAQRAGSPAAGDFRYNTTTGRFEGYLGSAWGSFGSSNSFFTNIFAGDGSDTTFTLSQTIDNENDLLVFIDGVFQAQNVYSVSGTTLTFATAPANGRVITVYSVKAGVSGSNYTLSTMTGDGSDTTLTLNTDPVNENNVQVYIDGVYQNKDTFSVSGTTLTFSEAPPNSTKVEAIVATQTTINTATQLLDADGDTKVMVEESADEDKIRFDTAGSERMMIDSSSVLIGSSTSISSNIGLQVTGTDAAGFISLFRDDSSVVADDDLGGILFYGDDNSATTQFAYMRATAEGTHADGDNPTAIRFGTTADGSESVTERMKIDNAGRVTMPYQPAFEATVGTAFSGDGSVSGDETFIFSNARVNVGSHYNASTGIFTAPVTGLYQINYFLNPSSSNVTARYFRAKLIKTSGGTDTVIYNAHCTINNPAGDADYNIVSASGVVSLTANDTLKVVFGSSLATSNYTFYVNLASFSGHLIG